MTEEEIKDKCERDSEAYLKAMRLNMESQQEYMGLPPVAPAHEGGGDKDRWRKVLILHLLITLPHFYFHHIQYNEIN